MTDWKMYGKIQEYKKQGFKKTQVSKKLSLNFRTVSKYWDMDPDEFSKTKRTACERSKRADIYRDEMIDMLHAHPDMQASQVYDRLEEKYEDKVEFAERTLRRYIRELRITEDIPKVMNVRQHEAVDDPPYGYQAQVDMGEIWLEKEFGGRIKLYCFAMVLSSSRYKYVVWQTKPFTTESFIMCHEKAFRFFGGRPKEIVYDQDKVLAVSENNGDIIYTEAFQNYISIKKFKVYLCRGADPESKGRVEAVVKYAKNNFAKHRVFKGINSFNEACMSWLRRRGNGKKHEITQKIPAEVFELEREYLTPVAPLEAAHRDDSVPYQVRKDNTIMYKSNRYRVPKGTYKQGLKVGLKIDGRFMSIVDIITGEIIAKHRISDERGKLLSYGHEGRDVNRNLERIYEKAHGFFSDGIAAGEFLDKVKESKPRYIRDQLGVIIKVGENERLCHHMDEALEYCIKNNLYSATDFKTATEYFTESNKIPETDCHKPTFMIKPPSARPEIRDLDEYARLMEV